MNENTDHYEGAILEDIRDQVRQLAESLADVPAEVHQLKVDVDELKSDVKLIKAAVTDQSRQLHDHETRIAGLEQAA